MFFFLNSSSVILYHLQFPTKTYGMCDFYRLQIEVNRQK